MATQQSLIVGTYGTKPPPQITGLRNDASHKTALPQATRRVCRATPPPVLPATCKSSLRQDNGGHRCGRSSSTLYRLGSARPDIQSIWRQATEAQFILCVFLHNGDQLVGVVRSLLSLIPGTQPIAVLTVSFWTKGIRKSAWASAVLTSTTVCDLSTDGIAKRAADGQTTALFSDWCECCLKC